MLIYQRGVLYGICFITRACTHPDNRPDIYAESEALARTR
jgi:hypothetical protein